MEEPISTQTGDVNLTSERQTKGVEEYEQPRYSRRDTILTMAGVLMVMLLASLDQINPLMAMPFCCCAIKMEGEPLLRRR